MVAAKTQPLYDVHPGVAMVQKWVAELKNKTGRSLEEWIALVKKDGPKDEKARREWLKKKHKLGSNSAWHIAERADGKGGEEDSPEAYLKAAAQCVEDQYAGPKEKLRPIYDALLNLGRSMGGDVKVCPCKNNCAALSRARFCADQADDQFARRLWSCADALQRKIAEAAD